MRGGSDIRDPPRTPPPRSHSARNTRARQADTLHRTHNKPTEDTTPKITKARAGGQQESARAARGAQQRPAVPPRMASRARWEDIGSVLCECIHL